MPLYPMHSTRLARNHLHPVPPPAPTPLTRLAERGMAARTSSISLGQGQGARAEALIAAGAKSGEWVVLQVRWLARELGCRSLRHERGLKGQAGSKGRQPALACVLRLSGPFV